MRIFWAVVALCLSIGMILAASCGKDTTRARNLMKDADEAWQVSLAQMEGIVEAQVMLVMTAVSGKTEHIQPEKFSDLTERIMSLIGQLQKVAAKYQKMEKTSGVDEYEKYASLMNDAVEAHIVCAELIKGFFDRLQPFFQKKDAVGLTEEINRLDEEFEQIENARNKANSLLKKAAEYRREKNLGG